eukprot:459419-Alexandrium_andersonii.AAC.1
MHAGTTLTLPAELQQASKPSSSNDTENSGDNKKKKGSKRKAGATGGDPAPADPVDPLVVSTRCVFCVLRIAS